MLLTVAGFVIAGMLALDPDKRAPAQLTTDPGMPTPTTGLAADNLTWRELGKTPFNGEDLTGVGSSEVLSAVSTSTAVHVLDVERATRGWQSFTYGAVISSPVVDGRTVTFIAADPLGVVRAVRLNPDAGTSELGPPLDLHSARHRGSAVGSGTVFFTAQNAIVLDRLGRPLRTIAIPPEHAAFLAAAQAVERTASSLSMVAPLFDAPMRVLDLETGALTSDGRLPAGVGVVSVTYIDRTLFVGLKSVADSAYSVATAKASVLRITALGQANPCLTLLVVPLSAETWWASGCDQTFVEPGSKVKYAKFGFGGGPTLVLGPGFVMNTDSSMVYALTSS